MTILEAVRDPQLFGSWFQEPSWRRWFVVLGAIFALPIDRLAAFGIAPDDALAIFTQHTKRQTWPTMPAREF